MYSLLRPFLFSLDPERAHDFALTSLNWLPSLCFKKPPVSSVNVMGLHFPHQIGLAAGLDKNGEYIDALSKLGFSFIEVGTVTPRPQIGNPKPRLFRLPKAGAIINRMGFNNLGVDNLINNVKKSSYTGILGINIGKNKDTPLDRAVDDYLYCLAKVYNFASYITINISSPNTPDLRTLQQEKFFNQLISQLCEEQQRLAERYQRFVPLVVKLSPDESNETLKQIASIVAEKKVAGIIATNTTCDHSAITGLLHGKEEGGLSGKPLAKRSTECLRLLKSLLGDAVTLIGVGGISNADTAQEKIQAGASLLQVYSGLIYQGPQLIYSLALSLNRIRQ